MDRYFRTTVVIENNEYIFEYSRKLYKGNLKLIGSYNNLIAYEFEDIIDLSNEKYIEMRDIHNDGFVLSKKTKIYEYIPIYCNGCLEEKRWCNCPEENDY